MYATDMQLFTAANAIGPGDRRKTQTYACYDWRGTVRHRLGEGAPLPSLTIQLFAAHGTFIVHFLTPLDAHRREMVLARGSWPYTNEV